MNHLQGEVSPYLRQHMKDPVDWYPWCEEAFEQAKEQNKPVFLSIGYSTCHWCHVMAEESFRDEEIAKVLNRSFISIKVDREQRPDVDSVYMAACQAFSGQGGWPLTILMTPDGRPFYAGTYFPKHGSFGRVGLEELLLSTEEQWKKNRDKLQRAGEFAVRQIQEILREEPGDPVVEPQLVFAPAKELKERFDTIHGGFGRAPKFPAPHQLLYLMELFKRDGDVQAKEMALQTLCSMYRGGLFDHVGGGFARYSTDAMFLIPHFEKMLTDNALLIMAYLEAYQITDDLFYRTVAERTIAYVMEELRSPEGGFYSAQDADAQEGEGSYYALRPDEVAAVIGRSDAEWFNRYYEITQEGNFEGKSIPNLLNNQEYRKEPRALPTLREKIYEYRAGRMPLHTDTKVITGGTALMAVALCRAYRCLGGERYLEAANAAIGFVHENMAPDGVLHRSYCEGRVEGRAALEDHTCLAWAYLELYRTTQAAVWLVLLVHMMNLIQKDFTDERGGGFYQTAGDAEHLIIRPKERYDGAAPSGNSMMAYLLCALGEITAEPSWQAWADRQLIYLAPAIRQDPAGHCFAALALLVRVRENRELIVQLRDGRRKKELLEKIFPYIDESLWMATATPEDREELIRIIPSLSQYPEAEAGSKFYLCRGHSCLAPVESMAELEILLRR